jgi:hypothetical protein
MSPQGALQVVRGRMRSRRGLDALKDPRRDWHYPILMTTTPRGRNWLYRAYTHIRLPSETDDAYASRRRRFKMVHATTYDNEQNLPVGYIDEQESAMQGDVQLMQQELEGLFVSFEGLVYPQFAESLHVRPIESPDPIPYESPEVIRRVAGVDFGGGDPTAIVILGQGRSGRIHQYAEHVWTKPVGDVELGGILHEWNERGKLDAVWCDPSNQTAIATFRSAGLPAGPQVNGPQGITARAINDRAQGIRLQGELLSRQMLTMNPNCSISIGEFYSYLYRKGLDGEGSEFRTSTPIDHHADCMDSRRYALMGLFMNKGRSNSMKPARKSRIYARRDRVAA